jgi:DNA-binding NarL/FixJ family response regulator
VVLDWGARVAIRVLVVDDHELIHLGCRSMLTAAGFDVAGTVTDGESALRAARTLAPDIILLDARLGLDDGLAWIPQIRAAAPEARIVVYSAFGSRPYVARALNGGAHDYVLKSASGAELIDVLNRVAAGEPTPRLANHRRAKDPPGPLPPGSEPGLTSREAAVLRHIAAGRSNVEIATELAISVETVKEHVQAVLRKTALVDRTQAALFALRHGLG